MSAQETPQKRGNHVVTIAMSWILPLAEIVIEVVDEVNNSAPTALVAVRALVRVGALVYASNRKV
ncbi:hypothetical protein ACWIDS_18325 [Dietzia maris]|jgi:hypothetical protein